MAFLGLNTLAQKGIFILYMGLWISYGLLNQHAKSSQLSFNTASAVLLQSLLKIAISVHLFVQQDGTVYELIQKAQRNGRVFMLYMIPAFLYAVYDILSYVNLQKLDPPTYFLLLQFRLVLTGFVHQTMFQRHLNRNQWMALLVTTAGCAIKTIGDAVEQTSDERSESSFVIYGLVFLQILSSTIAGVYNELLLKKQNTIPLNLQNIFMYINSVLVLLVLLSLGLTGQHIGEAIQWENMRILFYPQIFAMVVIMSCVGVVTSMFLKLLDSVRKAIASALELVVLPILTSLFFQIPITMHLILAVACVSSGVYLYSMPVTKVEDDVKDNDDDLDNEKSDILG